MTEQQIEFYGNLFQRLELNELKIEDEGCCIFLKKEIGYPLNVTPDNQKMDNKKNITLNRSVNNTSIISEKSKQNNMYDEMKAPLLGIFHRAPAPNEPPFVEEGDTVKKGDILCVIEAMKMMNEITASKDGVIKAIHAEENAIVEYGQVIFEIM